MATLVKTRPLLVNDGRVRGVRVTKNNVSKIATWIEKAGGTAEPVYEVKENKDGSRDIKDRVRLKTKKGIRVAQIGDVIIRGSERHVFGIIKAADFNGFDD